MMHKFKITLTLFWLISLHTSGFGQVAASDSTSQKAEIQAQVEAFCAALYQNDSTTMQMLFDRRARLLTVLSQGPVASLLEQDLGEFISAVGEPKTERWREVIWSYTIQVEGEMASVWCPYTFFLETDGIKQFMHCGVNSIELFRGPVGWQITQITDTRSIGNCREN